MKGKYPVWVIEEHEDGWWRIEGGPDSAQATDFGFIMETAAEEIKRLGVGRDEWVEVRKDGGSWLTRARHIVEDYGVEEGAR